MYLSLDRQREREHIKGKKKKKEEEERSRIDVFEVLEWWELMGEKHIWNSNNW